MCQPNYVNVYRDRGGVMGVVEFDTADDLDRAARARPSRHRPGALCACRDSRWDAVESLYKGSSARARARSRALDCTCMVRRAGGLWRRTYRSYCRRMLEGVETCEELGAVYKGASWPFGRRGDMRSDTKQ